METRNQGTSGTEIRRTPDEYESSYGSMSSETPSRDDSHMVLKDIGLSQLVMDQLHTVGRHRNFFFYKSNYGIKKVN